MKSPLTLLLVAALAVPSTAQFDLFSWDDMPNEPFCGGSAVTADSMEVIAGLGLCGVIGFQGFLTRAPVAGTVAVTIEHYMTYDGVCNSSVPVFAHNGELTQLASCTISNVSFAFEVAAGDGFGFGLDNHTTSFPGDVVFVEFSFTPASGFAYWTDLGQALGGALGPPTLTGQGLLHAGMPVKLNVGNAAPQQPATLVLGLSALEAPFKGGVMVPQPDLIVPSLFTGAGALQLTATWPSNLPAGVQLWMQVWIADLTAPLGWSATNGVLAATP
ncbi:MAG TPA: hypothetical protein VFD43_09255 [Planctomycetota bacterium]|nr:hypothetical protein [Planctomycetota bacterium]